MPRKINDGLTNQQRYHNKPGIREKRSQNGKEYRQTDKGIFTRNKHHWIGSGIREPLEGWESYWEKFKSKTHCELCKVEFNPNGHHQQGKNLDHDHRSRYIRSVACRKCNISWLKTFDIKHTYVLQELHRVFNLR